MPHDVSSPTELITERLRLVPVRLAELSRLHLHWIAPQVRRYLWDDRLITQDDVWDAIGDSLELEISIGLGLTCIFERSSKQFVGVAGLMQLPRGNTPTEPEIIYSLEPVFWGHGYATEASIAVLRYAFDTIGLPRVLGAADPPNTRSLKLLQRLQMQSLAHGPVSGLPYMHITRERFAMLHPA